MKNKNYEDIKLVEVECKKPEQRNDILLKGKILIECLSFEVEEYLALARVLICSKCMAIGHFRKQCQQQYETCKKCGTECPDLKQHNCTEELHCIHCHGKHQSNAMKCPVVKEFRSNLTKSLLSVPSNSNNNNNNNKFRLNLNDFQNLPSAQKSTVQGWKTSNHSDNNNDVILSKLNELNQNMFEVNAILEKLSSTNAKFEQFMINMTEQDKKSGKKYTRITDEWINNDGPYYTITNLFNST
jgi:hypothetical protein